ncbi:uncharacterized protein LOC126549585 [Aphis gossypii]|uniref:uncharacterized protein LOC126549585 n=1 Tax=Aphis gossypii TaxID=80765 RepID=UPI002159ABA5|nr:uncharacterized protein LOC126549585 [Aphis gossypii]
MASKNTFTTLYIYDSYSSRFGKIYAIKLVNDKIDEIKFDITERVEKRDDIDLIYKTFSSVTLLLQDKDLIIRISDREIKTGTSRRPKDMTFEIVRPKMTQVSILGGVDANIYTATREISSLHDCETVKMELPTFAVLLTPDQVDAKFDARRRRREDREKGLMTPASVTRTKRTLTDTPRTPISAGKSSLESDISKEIGLKVMSMSFSNDKLGSDDSSDEDEDSCTEDKALEYIERDSKELSYSFKSKELEIVRVAFSAPHIFMTYYEKEEKSKKTVLTKKGAGCRQSGLCQCRQHSAILTLWTPSATVTQTD